MTTGVLPSVSTQTTLATQTTLVTQTTLATVLDSLALPSSSILASTSINTDAANNQASNGVVYRTIINNLPVVIAGAVGALVVILAIVLATVFICRYKRNTKVTTEFRKSKGLTLPPE